MKAKNKRNSAVTAAAVHIGITTERQLAEMDKSIYSPDNLISYHTALSLVDRMENDGVINKKEKSILYAKIAEKYGLNPNSIFAA